MPFKMTPDDPPKSEFHFCGCCGSIALGMTGCKSCEAPMDKVDPQKVEFADSYSKETHTHLTVSPARDDGSDTRLSIPEKAQFWTIYAVNNDGMSEALHDAADVTAAGLALRAISEKLELPVSYASGRHTETPVGSLEDLTDRLAEIIHDEIPGYDDVEDFRDDDFENHPLDALRFPLTQIGEKYQAPALSSMKFLDPATPRAKVIDNDENEVRIEFNDKPIRSWEYRNDDERREKMKQAREFTEGFHQAQLLAEPEITSDPNLGNGQIREDLIRLRDRVKNESRADGDLLASAVNRLQALGKASSALFGPTSAGEQPKPAKEAQTSNSPSP